MIDKVNKIIIVGGGSAGWMSAAFLKKTFPNKTITLIESQNTPTVGVGESTLESIRKFCLHLEIDEKEFMKFTDASYKLSIKFTNFYEKDSGSFYYPFGQPYIENSNQGVRDWFFIKALYPDIPNTDFVDSYFPASALWNANKFTKDATGFDNWNPNLNYAYHFDATKFGVWLRDHYCIPRGVNHIIGDVVVKSINDDGIVSLKVGDKDHKADLYIDCTGFQSLLLDKTLKEPFDSYSDLLPNNKAWATRLPYKNKEQELEPYTNCTAIENGWVWNIPLWSRIGTGYVYSDKFCSDEEALDQFKKYLKTTKQRTDQDIKELEFKNIKMRVGLHSRTFVKNVVAIGLSAGFIEPLESNGLFTVTEFLWKLAKTLERGKVSQWDKDVYNIATQQLFEDFAEFVALHYALTNRTDTEYWRECFNKEYFKNVPNQNFVKHGELKGIAYNKMFLSQTAHVGNTYIATGMNYNLLDSMSQKLYQFEESDHELYFSKYIEQLQNNKLKWKQQALTAPTLFQYIESNIQSD